MREAGLGDAVQSVGLFIVTAGDSTGGRGNRDRKHKGRRRIKAIISAV